MTSNLNWNRDASTISSDIFEGTGSWTGGFLFPPAVPLHSMLAGCGYETRSTPDYSYDGLQRGQAEFAIFQYTVAGEGTLDYEGRVCKMHPGDAMLLHIPHRHRYFLAEGTPCWRHCFLTISGSDAVRLMREAEKRFGPVVKLPRNSPPVEWMLHILQAGRDRQLKSACTASALVYHFVTSLHDHLAADRGGGEQQDRQMLRKIHQYCLDHLTEDVSVSGMAAEAGLSRAYFSRRFKGEYGVSPAEFLMKLRLNSAIRMLQLESGLSIKEISVRCGFNDESYFCKVFRRHYGISPEKFRQANAAE